MSDERRDALREAMKQMDICFMTTWIDQEVTSRPMSNNGQVEWDGDNWFFTNSDTRKIAQITANPRAILHFSNDSNWIVLHGQATLHRDDKALFEKHWVPDLEKWFEQGIETPGLTLIEVQAEIAELAGRVGDGRLSL